MQVIFRKKFVEVLKNYFIFQTYQQTSLRKFYQQQGRLPPAYFPPSNSVYIVF